MREQQKQETKVGLVEILGGYLVKGAEVVHACPK